jgi:D-methionine transport system ATP-binding protein
MSRDRSTADPILTFKSLGLQGSLGGRWQVQGLSGQVRAGELLLVTGASGSGKTTLLRLFDGLVSPTAGELTWWGQSLTQIGPIELHRRIAWVSQSPRLLGLSVRQTLLYPLECQGCTESIAAARLAEVLPQFTIPEDWLDRRQEQLSPSEALWVTIARAEMIQPQILLLDDVLEALEAPQQSQLLRHLKGKLDQGLALIASSGQPQLWRDLAETVPCQVLILGPEQQPQPLAGLDWADLSPQTLIDHEWE